MLFIRRGKSADLDTGDKCRSISVQCGSLCVGCDVSCTSRWRFGSGGSAEREDPPNRGGEAFGSPSPHGLSLCQTHALRVCDIDFGFGMCREQEIRVAVAPAIFRSTNFETESRVIAGAAINWQCVHLTHLTTSVTVPSHTPDFSQIPVQLDLQKKLPADCKQQTERPTAVDASSVISFLHLQVHKGASPLGFHFLVLLLLGYSQVKTLTFIDNFVVEKRSHWCWSIFVKRLVS